MDSPNPQKNLLRERKGVKVDNGGWRGAGAGGGLVFHKAKLVVSMIA